MRISFTLTCLFVLVACLSGSLYWKLSGSDTSDIVSSFCLSWGLPPLFLSGILFLFGFSSRLIFYGVKRPKENVVVDLCICSMFYFMLYTCFCRLLYFVLGFLMSIDKLSTILISSLYIASGDLLTLML
ncbi:hypothetical protein V8F06_002613 [Rhypophila decipiens]